MLTSAHKVLRQGSELFGTGQTIEEAWKEIGARGAEALGTTYTAAFTESASASCFCFCFHPTSGCVPNALGGY